MVPEGKNFPLYSGEVCLFPREEFSLFLVYLQPQTRTIGLHRSPMAEKIIILDCGSQVTQLIGRRLREINVFCEIYPFNKMPELDKDTLGVIISGSPCSVRDANAPKMDLSGIKGKLPLLGICYGAQYLAATYGGKVEGSLAREYGRAMMDVVDSSSPLLAGVESHSQVWMSHGDTISALPEGGKVLASTADVKNAAFRIEGEHTYAVQFHPEVFHTTEGATILGNFAFGLDGFYIKRQRLEQLRIAFSDRHEFNSPAFNRLQSSNFVVLDLDGIKSGIGGISLAVPTDRNIIRKTVGLLPKIDDVNQKSARQFLFQCPETGNRRLSTRRSIELFVDAKIPQSIVAVESPLRMNCRKQSEHQRNRQTHRAAKNIKPH